jgi:hypothetical protein
VITFGGSAPGPVKATEPTPACDVDGPVIETAHWSATTAKSARVRSPSASGVSAMM